MKKIIFFIFLLFAGNVYATENVTIGLEKAPVHFRDMSSIKRGAKSFATMCMACHTLIYLRYDNVAKEAGITYEKMPINVTNWPLNVRPPDLSLEADLRGTDWIYTYLHSFYTDPSRPLGVNNLLLPNTAMAGILVPLQGQQVLASDLKQIQKIYNHSLQWYDVLELKTQGTMTPLQFDAFLTDIVNFLAYAANPYEREQQTIGWWVLGFLVILFILTYLLKKAYWKDVD